MKFPHKQRGMTLVMLVFVIGLAAVGYLLYALNPVSVKNERDKKTALALAEAKVALIGYASAQPRPGSLPCPDTNNDGTTDTNGNVNCYSNIGRLPWKTLGLEDLHDGHGERIWYALSTNFSTVPSSLIINSDAAVGLLNVCPAGGCGDPSPVPAVPSAPFPIYSQQVAILFSPSYPLAGQDRQDGVDANPNPVLNIDNAKKSNNFLDVITIGANQFNNASGSNNGNDFIMGPVTSTFNDSLLTISTNEIFGNIDKRMQSKATLAEIASCLIEYANNNAAANDKRLPWSVPFDLGPAANYNDPINFDDTPSIYTGRIAYHIADSTAASPIHDWNTGAASKRKKMEYCSNWPSWWNSWKNHVFYAVSKDFAPDIAAPQVCSGNCVTVDGIGPFAAVLIFAGKKLAGQVRVSNTDMANPANFLEGRNAIEIVNNSGSGDFTAITTPIQNDVAICIRQNLTIDMTCTTP